MQTTANPRAGLGAELTRTEDFRFLTGQGHYTDDTQTDTALHAYVLRSPHAHAKFEITDIDAAREATGVVLVLTANDVSHMGSLSCSARMKQPDGSMPELRDIPLLCTDSVHHVGDAVAMVVADTLNNARDAAELIEIDYDAQVAIVDTARALDNDVPLVFDGAESNLAYSHFEGDAVATKSAFDAADMVAEINLINNRLVCNYMEPRACVAEWHADNDNYTVRLSSQGVHGIRDTLAEVAHLDPDKIRVITTDVGGGFGTKVFCYREYPLCMAAARMAGRPVRWNADRTEHFVQDVHGRDNVTTARMAMDASGRFLGIEVDLVAAMGAYLHAYGPLVPFLGVTMTTGAYAIPCMAVSTRGVYTNTTPVDAYRGAGRPEAAYVIERLVDQCATVSGISVDEIRRRNFIQPHQFPYRTPGGRTYDVGEFEQHMTRCMELANWQSFGDRAAAAKERGCLRGIGMSTYIEACAFAGSEPAFLHLEPDGRCVLRIGTQSNGQGHATAYAQITAGELGMDYAEINVHQGDTASLPTGGGTGGSRSIPLGGASALRAGRELATKLKRLAARELKCDADKIKLEDGIARVVGSNEFLSFADLAALGNEEELTAQGEWKQPEATYPNGTHISEIEIDVDTGVTRVVNYSIVDDFGVTVNPLLLQGQIHGGVVQGIGQCLMEHVVYDDTGQLLTATLLDYALPRADSVPNLHFETRNVPSTTNELGIKGAGEAGSIGSCPAVMNAISNALLREFSDPQIDMPVTPLAMWNRLNALRGQGHA